MVVIDILDNEGIPRCETHVLTYEDVVIFELKEIETEVDVMEKARDQLLKQ